MSDYTMILSDYSGSTITKSDIKIKMISGVTDLDDNGYTRDGSLNILNVDVIIFSGSTAAQPDTIDSTGDYTVMLSIRDIANNYRSYTKTVTVT